MNEKFLLSILMLILTNFLHTQTNVQVPEIVIQNTLTNSFKLRRTNSEKYYLTNDASSIKIWDSRQHINLQNFETNSNLFYFDGLNQKIAFFPTRRKDICLIYDTEKNEEVDSLKIPYFKSDVRKVLVIEKELFIVYENNITIYNWENKSKSSLYPASTTIHKALVIQDDITERLMVLRDNNQIDIWFKGTKTYELKTNVNLEYAEVDYCKNLLALGADNQITLLDLSSGKEVSKIKAVSISPTVKLLSTVKNSMYVDGRAGYYSEIYNYDKKISIDTIYGMDFIEFPSLDKAIYKSNITGRYLGELSLKNWTNKEIKPSCSPIKFMAVSSNGDEIILGHDHGPNKKDITRIDLKGEIVIKEENYSDRDAYCLMGSSIYSYDFENQSYYTLCAQCFPNDSIRFFVNGPFFRSVSPKGKWAYRDDLNPKNPYFHDLTLYNITNQKDAKKNGEIENIFQNFEVHFTPSEEYICVFEGSDFQENNSNIHIYKSNPFRKETSLRINKSSLGISCMTTTDSLLYFSADSNEDEKIFVYDLKKKVLVDSLEINAGFITKIQVSKSGKYLVINDYSAKQLKIWSIGDKRFISQIHLNEPSYIHFVKNDSLIVISSITGELVLWYWQTGEMINIYPMEENSFLAVSNSKYYYMSRELSDKIFYRYGKYTYPFEQFDTRFNRPDKVLESLGNADTILVEMYRKAHGKRIRNLGIDSSINTDSYTVPVADVVGRDQIEYELVKKELQIRVVADDSVFKLDRFNIWVNEVPLFGERGHSLRYRNLNKLDTTITIHLSEGENRIETSVTNSNAIESFRSPLYVNYTPEIPYTPKTHFIGIGIDKFKEEGHDLSYSVKDVRDLSKALKEKLGDQLTIDTLFNQNVNVSNVQALKKRLLQTNINDKVIISYSGHGLLNEEYDYFLSAYNVEFLHPENGGIPYEVLEDLLDSIPARKKLLLIDACHSGEVDKDDFREMAAVAGAKGLVQPKGAGATNTSSSNTVGLQNSFQLMQELFVNVQKGSGATIISAAAGDQFALEGGILENGFFTYAILKYMKEQEDASVNSLKKYVYTEVEKLSGGLQKPTSRIENLELDWKVW